MNKTSTGSDKGKSKSQIEREKVLAQLDAADNEVPQNPGIFSKSTYKNGESFADLFEKSL
ncbi:hypothetical protein GW916_13410, partial [bacterium]|nr:hypothetical protein [bacterium]